LCVTIRTLLVLHIYESAACRLEEKCQALRKKKINNLINTALMHFPAAQEAQSLLPFYFTPNVHQVPLNNIQELINT
jgi:hypothetical protein